MQNPASGIVRRTPPLSFSHLLRLAATGAVVAACGGGEATATCLVTAVNVSPANAEVEVGASTPLTGSLAQTNCTPLPALTWSSSAPSTASVTQSGVVTGVAAGTATISAAAQGRTGNATIVVREAGVAAIEAFNIPPTAAGNSLQITVVLRDSHGNVLANRVCTWLSSLPAGVSVTSPGMTTTLTVLNALAVEGVVTVTVTCEGVSYSTGISVTPIPVATVIVLHDSTALALGESGLARVELRDDDNQVIVGRAVVWSVSDMSRALVPPGSAWTQCATEGGTCAFPGLRQQVRYGAGDAFFYREIFGGTPCDNSVFGDPLVGVSKACFTAELATTTSGTGGLEVTAIGVGDVVLSAAPVVNPRQVHNEVTVPMVPEFRVTAAESVDPHTGRTSWQPGDVPFGIEMVDVLTFTNSVDEASFTIGNVFVRATGGAVLPPEETGLGHPEGPPEPNVFSYMVVHNEATDYTFNFTSGLKDIYGKALKNPGSISYRTLELDPYYYYRITSDFSAPSYVLAVSPFSTSCALAFVNDNDLRQFWYPVLIPPDRTRYQLRNRFYGDDRALESETGAVPCRMDPQANVTGQRWFSVPLSPTRWRLHSDLQGLTMALDLSGGSYVPDPYMRATGPSVGQSLYFIRAGRR